jgi:hypothetical protein
MAAPQTAAPLDSSAPKRARKRTAREPTPTRTCAGCGLTKTQHAFRGRRHDRTQTPSPLCRRCERYGVDAERARLAALASGELDPNRRLSRAERITIGLATAHAACPPGWCRTTHEIADFAGVEAEYIRRIEQRIFRKIRKGLGPLLTEAHIAFLEALE